MHKTKKKIMIKNILQENMIRFRTKNMTEGLADVNKISRFADEIESLVFTPGQSDQDLDNTINNVIQGLGGPAEAAKVILGVFETINKNKGLLKAVPRGAFGTEKLDVALANRIVDRLPFDDAIKKQIRDNIMQIAQDLGIATSDGATSDGATSA
jgi:hypothetical protein